MISNLRLKFIMACLLFSSMVKAQSPDVPISPEKESRIHKKNTLQYFSLAATNNHSAFPFSSFSSLIAGEWHPGVEFGSGLTWCEKKKHDWVQEFRVGYFFHQFIQHGIPLYTSFGYRYKFNPRWNAQAGIGAGYFHSIPNQARYKLNNEGDYEKMGGIGRGQAMLAFNLGGGYKFNMDKTHPLEAFITYQQRIQTPFVPSYVPLLPYNTIMLGFKRFR